MLLRITTIRKRQEKLSKRFACRCRPAPGESLGVAARRSPLSTINDRPGVVLGPARAGTLMTPEEFDAVDGYDEDDRDELIHEVTGALASEL